MDRQQLTKDALSIPLDVQTHQQGDKHRFGETFQLPDTPKAGTSNGSAGTSETPARADHSHPTGQSQVGVDNLTFTAVSFVNDSVIFSPGFDTVPVVTLTLEYAGTERLAAKVTSRSSSGFTYRVFEMAGSNVSTAVNVLWKAEVNGS